MDWNFYFSYGLAAPNPAILDTKDALTRAVCQRIQSEVVRAAKSTQGQTIFGPGIIANVLFLDAENTISCLLIQVPGVACRWVAFY